MSKRRRRNSRRRKSSSSSKHGISPCNFQKQACPVHNVVNEDDIEEKGQSDSFHKENMSSETDEEENKAEIPSKEKIIRTGSCGNSFRGKKAADTTGLDDQDKGVKITTSVMIDDSEISTPRVVFQRSHESGAGGAVSSIIAVTTAKIKSVSPNMRLEIQELWQSFDTDLKTTVVLQSQKGEDKTCFQSQRSQTCQESPNSTEFGQYREHDNVSIKVSIAELNVDVKDTMKNPRSCQCHDEMDCCKSCCEDHFYSHNAFGHSDTDFTVVDGSSSLSASSDFWPKVKRLSLPTSTSHEAMWDIPPPQEFADKQCDILDGLSENIAACQISADDHDANQGDSPAIPDALQNNVECNCHSSFDREDRVRSDLDSNERFFKRPKTPMSRSSFTKNFVHSHERQSRIRNNSFTILETKTGASGYMESPAKRRKTFPGETDDISQRQDTMPCYRESFSSGSLTSFFSQSFPLQAQRSDRYYLEDEGHFPFAESRKASSTSSYRPSSSSIGGQDTFLSSLMAYRKTKNPFYPSRSDETEDLLLKNGQTPAQKDNITMVSMMADGGVLCLEGADQESSSAGPKCEVTESGFDEDMIDLEEGNLESIMQEPGRRDLLIRVTPPTPYTSEDHISDGVFTRANEDITVKPTTFVYEGPASHTAQRKRGNSVTTVIIGDFEQRFLHNDPKPVNRDTSEKRQQDTTTVSPVSEEPAVSPTDVPETGRSSDVTVKLSPLCEEPTVSPPDVPEIGMGSDVMVSLNSQTAESSSSSQIAIKPTELKVNTTISSEKPNNVSSPQDSNGDSAIPSQNIHTQTNQIQDKGSTDGQRATKLAQRDSAERQSVTKSSLEVKEHLRPLADPVHKDPEDPPDHWAKRRKLFKESREWSSAGGSSFTSIITEESDTMNSEDTRSVDMSVRDIEDRGFYTETFHSASWIYRGDDVNPTEGPACLSNRPRPVTIRDRTVKIIKGTGDYPWGFRIQYSKPIVVTEVDTNGAAEEAGLLVGDYVLAVNGTDVTSVPHSEAADLARQGPDLLTLIIGSDISRCPNTPRPACRGYLHKRTQSSLLKGWRKRWFVLRHDCCLYYYRNKRDEGKSTAFTSMKLEGAVVEADSSLGKPFVFKCCPVSGNRVYYFCATSNQEMKRWLEAMDRAVHPVTQNHVWVDVTRHNSSLPPLAVKNPECLGLLHQLDVNKDAWMQHYSILKDGCLYFYASIRSTSALGGIYLHGYTVREQPFGSKRSAIELKPPSEEFKTFIMCAENANENKRWILAIKSSIGKWLPLHQAIQDFMNRPPEETRM